MLGNAMREATLELGWRFNSSWYNEWIKNSTKFKVRTTGFSDGIKMND
jgi:hypothetical protein